MTKDNTDKFLEEMTALTYKYGLIIGGCGCCGSPFIVSLEDKTKDDVGDESNTYSYVFNSSSGPEPEIDFVKKEATNSD